MHVSFFKARTSTKHQTHTISAPYNKFKHTTYCSLRFHAHRCGATTLAIENRVPTLIAVPTVNLIKNKLPEHADLLGVYGGVTNQEIADYLKAHDR